jgi:hypothetical protein
VPTQPTLLAINDGDLVSSTLRDLGRGRWTDLSSRLQRHIVMRHLTRQNRIGFESGYGIQFDVNVLQSDAAANVGLGASDDVNIIDTLIQGQVDWRNTTTNYGFEGRELAMNRDPARIVDLVRKRRLDSMISLAEIMESNFWGSPVASTDVLTPWGINTWCVKNATEGFNGGAPSGYTVIGNINPTTYPAWNNWTYEYVAVSRDDLIRHWRKAATFTDFQPTVDGIPTFDTGDEYGFYTNYSVLGPLEEALESQNDNLGNDIASQDGETHFRKVPVRWVPFLEADTTNPVYGIDWGVFKTIILKGWWLKETAIPIYPGQHTISAHFLDSTYNWTVYDRRRLFVLATGTTYPA